MGIKTPWLTKFRHISWVRLGAVLMVTTAAWAGLATALPYRWHTIVLVILVDIQTTISLAIRLNKYVTDRNELPPPGVTP